MKRYISLALAAVVLVLSLAVPSYAAGTDLQHYYEVLDFSSPNGGSNFNSTVAGSNIFSFDLPTSTQLYGLDVLISSRNPLSSANIVIDNDRFPLSVYHVNENVYRLVGSPIIDNFRDLVLEFNYDSSGWVDFLSVKYYLTPSESFVVPASGFISYGNGEEAEFYYNSDDDYSGVTLPGSSNWSTDDYRAYITIPEFYTSDFINLQVYISQLDINSISISTNNINIPFEVSYLNPDSFGGTLVNLTIDCRDLAYYNETLQVSILGSVASIDTIVCYIGILYSSGVVFSSTPNQTKFFFADLKNFFSGFFSNLSSWINDQTSSINGFINNLRFDIDNFNTSVGTWFTNLSDWIISLRNTLRDTIDNWSSLIYNNVYSINQWFIELCNNFVRWFDTLFSKIDSWGLKIVDAIVGDQTENETINNALDTQESVNEQINVQLGSAVDDWDGNVSVVSGGFNTAFQNASPSLNWLSNLAQSVFSGMGWFGNMFFFLGFLHVFFLLMSKSGLGRSIANAARRSDSK